MTFSLTFNRLSRRVKVASELLCHRETITKLRLVSLIHPGVLPLLHRKSAKTQASAQDHVALECAELVGTNAKELVTVQPSANVLSVDSPIGRYMDTDNRKEHQDTEG